jgi:hypothetical protein
MTITIVPVAVQQRDLPAAIRSLTTMASPDYVDAFTITMSEPLRGSPERWARAGIEEAAGDAGQFVWRELLGLRLEQQPSSEHIGGWTIADRGDTWIRLEAASWFLTAHLVILVDDREVTVATFIQYDRPFAELVWPLLSVGHRKAMPGLLRHAVTSVARVTPGDHVHS